MTTPRLSMALLCGGPSLERGISLNSARSVLDHTALLPIDLEVFYVDQHRQFYSISPNQLYSNTPSDFDFKLKNLSTPLIESERNARLQAVDLIFPAIHGAFGEDGELQALLESLGVNFVGSTSQACRRMFDKYTANAFLKSQGFPTLPALLVKATEHYKQEIVDFWEAEQIEKAVIKPVAGGSSIGVTYVTSVELAIEKAEEMLSRPMFDVLLIEPFCTGREFTLCVVQNEQQQPVAMVPTEIDMQDAVGSDQPIFDYRRKYLPTAQVRAHCPPRFSPDLVAHIRQQAQAIFQAFDMRDFARVDGWLLEDGTVCFSDMNPISGMEQNSFLFQQAARVGMSHSDLLSYVITQAQRRRDPHFTLESVEGEVAKQPVFVLMGGQTAERQVSLMSGTNAWLKLRQSARYQPTPFLLDLEGRYWNVPYPYILHHTVEEVMEYCQASDHYAEIIYPLAGEIRTRLGLKTPMPSLTTTPVTLAQIITRAQAEKAFIFLGFHGGEGEDGTLQAVLDEVGLPYNGSGPETSRLCMDKYATSQRVTSLNEPGVRAMPEEVISVARLGHYSSQELEQYWREVTKRLGSETLIVKPRSDGCSAGVIRLHHARDLYTYVRCLEQELPFLPPDTFEHHHTIIEMSCDHHGDFLLEPCIITDYVRVEQQQLTHRRVTGWVEVTIGVLECSGHYHALNPSITVAEGAVLSLEEKFQGGTGINITPPPPSLMSPEHVALVRKYTEIVAKGLGIQNYARIDLFVELATGTVLVIEANSLPGITPSTVIFHQALAEMPTIIPREFFELLIGMRLGTAKLPE